MLSMSLAATTAGLIPSSVLLSSQALADTQIYLPQIRASLGTTSHFFEVVVRGRRLRLRPQLRQVSSHHVPSSPSSLLSSLEFSDTQDYEPEIRASSEPLHISAKKVFEGADYVYGRNYGGSHPVIYPSLLALTWSGRPNS